LNSALKRRTLPNPAANDLLERRIGEQPLGEQESLRLREFDGRHAKFGFGHASQMPIADAERGREIADVRARQGMFFDAGHGRAE
jgi:hypothetical protein